MGPSVGFRVCACADVRVYACVCALKRMNVSYVIFRNYDKFNTKQHEYGAIRMVNRHGHCIETTITMVKHRTTIMRMVFQSMLWPTHNHRNDGKCHKITVYHRTS